MSNKTEAAAGIVKTIRQLFQLTRQTVAVWWAVDRVRVNPSAGRLLQLRVGDEVMIRNELFAVTGRDVVSRRGSAEVRYRLQGDAAAAAALCVRRSAEGQMTGSLSDGTATIPVFDEDLVIISPPREFSATPR